MKPTRVFIADPHPLMCAGVAGLLTAHGPQWEICGTATDSHQAVAKTSALQPDIVILDYEMPLVGGLETTRQIRRRVRDAEILILIDTPSRRVLRRISDSDIPACLLKSEAEEELIPALESLRHHRTFRSRGITALCRNDAKSADGTEDLTPREKEILCLVANGKSSKKIAAVLYITLKTVEGHRAELRRKLRLKTSIGLTRYAIREGLVDL